TSARKLRREWEKGREGESVIVGLIVASPDSADRHKIVVVQKHMHQVFAGREARVGRWTDIRLLSASKRRQAIWIGQTSRLPGEELFARRNFLNGCGARKDLLEGRLNERAIGFCTAARNLGKSAGQQP